MKITNIQAGTNPIVIHAPGFTCLKVLNLGIWHHYYSNPLWAPIKRCYNRSRPKRVGPEDTEDLTIITWNNNQKKGILEECLDEMGVPYLVLGKGIKEWKNIFKIRLNYETLSNIKTKYVMGLDAYDVLLLESPREVVKRFEGFSCEMLFNASTRFYPPCHQFQLPGERFITRDWEEFQSSISDSNWKYLNSGMWIGKTAFCRKFFAECLSRKTKELVGAGKLPSQMQKATLWQNITDTDQLVFHWVFQDYFPQVQLDYNCKIFLNLAEVHSGRHILLDRNFYEILLWYLSMAFIIGGAYRLFKKLKEKTALGGHFAASLIGKR